jgi:hypothetical protein
MKSLSIICVIAMAVSFSTARGQAAKPSSYEMSVTTAADDALKYRLLPETGELVSANAATLYLMATTMANTRPDDFWERIDQLDNQPAEQWEKKDVQDSLDSAKLSLMDLAARRDRCVWDSGIQEQGYAALLPHLNPLRSKLARMLSLRTRLAISEGRWEDAAYSLQSGMALSYHLSNAEHAVLVEALVGVSIRGMVCQNIREWISTPGSPNLYWALADAERPAPNLAASLQEEKESLYRTFPFLRRARQGSMTAEQYQSVAAELRGYLQQSEAGKQGGGQLPSVEQLRAAALDYLKRSGVAEGQLNQLSAAALVGWYMTDDYDRSYDSLSKWLGLPYPQAIERLQHDELAIDNPDRQQGNPLLVFIPKYSKAFTMVTQDQRELTALQAIESIRAYAAAHNGQPPKSLDDLTDMPVPADPITGQPFIYQAREGGFTLDGPAPLNASEKSIHYNVTIKQ